MRLLIVIALFVFGCSSSQIASNGTKTIPMKDFFRNPEQSRFMVSPKGQKIAFLKPWNSRMNIFVQSLSSDRLPTGEPVQATKIKDRDISFYFWKDDNTLVYSRDFGGDENFHIFVVDLATNQERDLTPFEKTRAGVVDDLKEVSDTDILIEMNKRNIEIFDVYRLNLRTGEYKMVAQNPGKYVGWKADHTGQIRLAMESDGLKTKVYARKTEKDPFKKVIEYDYTSGFEPQFFTFDNKLLYASSNLGRDKSAFVLVNPNTGKETKLIFKHLEVDVGYMGFSRKRKVLTWGSFITDRTEKHFFDKTEEQRFQKLKSLIGNFEIDIVSRNDDEDLFTVQATSDKTKGLIYLYDDRANKLTLLADTAPWLKAEDMAEMKPIQYKSRDGLDIHGYLVLPKGSTGKNLPIIVNPHGGPWSRVLWRFNPEAQFLANRGYALFQMNFRGSTGYGKKFFTSSFKQWGRKMQDDVTDGVQWLISTGVANPKKICIYGGSYGGYTTLAGVAFTPDLYACAVDYVGVSNLLTFLKTIPPYWKTELEKMYAMIGHPDKEVEMMKAASPVFHADKIKTPLMVVQGAKDPRVNINESNQIVESLRKRNVEVKYIVKENEGHGFRNEENRFEFYGAMEDFFKKYLN